MHSYNHASPTTAGGSLEPPQKALARHRSYGLLSRLYLEGVTPALLPVVTAVPELAAHLPSPFHADEAAADYQHLFGFNVFPFEAIFREEDGLLGGAVSEAVAASYRRAGYAPETAASSADHIGHELGLLAFLCGAETDAWGDGVPAAVQRTQALEREFLHAHLLPWLPPLVVALRRQGDPFFAAVADLTLALAAEHTAALGKLPAEWLLPALPQGDESQTGLREIARRLLTPVYSGLYLSREDIGALAHTLALPRGFGGREQTFVNLLRAAAQYEVMGALVERLEQVVEGWRGEYRMMGEPALLPYAAAWEARAAATAGFLQEMGEQLRTAVADRPDHTRAPEHGYALRPPGARARE